MNEAPDLIVPVVGYRQWRVARNARGEAELRSGGVGDAAWIPGTNRASCKLTQLAAAGTYSPSREVEAGGATPHEAPGSDCSCGIYGTHVLAAPEDPTLPTGAIIAWGRIEVHQSGFRAELSQVAVLGLPQMIHSDVQRELVEEAAERYGVPCVPGDQVERFALELGAPIPAKLWPQKIGDYDYRPRSTEQPGQQPVYGATGRQALLGLGGPFRQRGPIGMGRRGPIYDPMRDEEGVAGEPVSQMTLFLGTASLLAIFALIVLIATLV